VTAFEILCRGVSVLKDLKTLQLAHLALGMYSFERITKAIAGLMHLEILHLEGNFIESVFINRLFTEIPKPSGLRECILDENDINDEGALLLSQHLPQFPDLQVLSLRLNPLTPQGLLPLLPFKERFEDLRLPEVLPYKGQT
jgi:Ran GTPase-activating protein (RanGAP) involved in mRNA processing and transport